MTIQSRKMSQSLSTTTPCAPNGIELSMVAANDNPGSLQPPEQCQVVSDWHSNESKPRSGVQLSLDAIMRHFARLFRIDITYDRVGLYEVIASELSEISKRRWSWRYVLSIRSGTIQPGGLMINAVAQLHEQILFPPLSPRPPRIAVLKGDAEKAVDSLFGPCGLDPEVRDEFVKLVSSTKAEIEY